MRHRDAFFILVLGLSIAGIIYVLSNPNLSPISWTESLGYNPVKPKLSLINMNYGNAQRENFGDNCNMPITGIVTNTGDGEANQTVVTCRTFKTDGGLLGSNTVSVGNLLPGKNSAFQLTVSWNCYSQSEFRYSCLPDCNNC